MGSRPKLVFSVFLSGATLLFAILLVSALCVGILRMFIESELRKNIYRFPTNSQGPVYFPVREEFAMHPV